MVHAGCGFVPSIHPSRTWTSGSFESVRWNACVHRLDLGLYSHPKEFLGNEVWTHVDSKGKIPSTGKFPQRRIEPVTLWTASPNTTNELSRPPNYFLCCLFVCLFFVCCNLEGCTRQKTVVWSGFCYYYHLCSFGAFRNQEMLHLCVCVYKLFPLLFVCLFVCCCLEGCTGQK